MRKEGGKEQRTDGQIEKSKKPHPVGRWPGGNEVQLITCLAQHVPRVGSLSLAL